MVNSKIFEENHDLMVTYTDDETKILHKINTDEYYDDPIDLVVGHYTEGYRSGQPMGLYEYEEVDRQDEDEPEPVEVDVNNQNEET